MNSQQVKQAFRAAGLSVRVADLGMKFRVCPTGAHFPKAEIQAVAASLGLTNVLAELGGQFNGSQEFICYRPGAVVRA